MFKLFCVHCHILLFWWLDSHLYFKDIYLKCFATCYVHKRIQGTTEPSKPLAAVIFLQYQTHLGKVATSREMHLRCLKTTYVFTFCGMTFSLIFFSHLTYLRLHFITLCQCSSRKILVFNFKRICRLMSTRLFSQLRTHLNVFLQLESSAPCWTGPFNKARINWNPNKKLL